MQVHIDIVYLYIQSFGPGSPQTTTAAANLIRAGGKKPDGPGVADMIAKAVAATGGMPAAVKPAVTPPEAVNPDEPSASPEAVAKAGAE